jgi:hypothetical protein
VCGEIGQISAGPQTPDVLIIYRDKDFRLRSTKKDMPDRNPGFWLIVETTVGLCPRSKKEKNQI